MPKAKAQRKPAAVPRTPTPEERAKELAAVERLRQLGTSKGYNRMSERVASAFIQYRKGGVTNKERRNLAYHSLSGLLTFGLHRAPPGTYYIYSQEVRGAVRDCYPGGEESTGPINSNNRPTKNIDADDLFEDKA
ncbi:PREDICTED: uncharacterized protein LOC109476100 [Branchiostoma belcheri]|uniref:Uncharacterized protein LOC109476100 n=1 Tax=Branchiostoma belcheri TaxID=7741 RepID=A0A6P4ZF30_BRABE|nr:PREDICTED: uncharacterized protein LOC109476100 [Branchiostoma belcheri]